MLFGRYRSYLGDSKQHRLIREKRPQRRVIEPLQFTKIRKGCSAYFDNVLQLPGGLIGKKIAENEKPRNYQCEYRYVDNIVRKAAYTFSFFLHISIRVVLRHIYFCHRDRSINESSYPA